MRMNQLKLLPFLLASLLMACASLPAFWRAGRSAPGGDDAEGGQVPPPRTLLELQDVHFDGEYLSGRLLVGVAEGKVTLDKRLIENASVEVQSVFDCATEQPVGFLEVDSFPRPARSEDLLTLTPGYWYGANVRFLLFDAKFTGRQAPDCIEVALALRGEDGGEKGHLRVRAEQATRRPPGDGGADSPSEHAPDHAHTHSGALAQ
jgi:hypothetical protein